MSVRCELLYTYVSTGTKKGTLPTSIFCGVSYGTTATLFDDHEIRNKQYPQAITHRENVKRFKCKCREGRAVRNDLNIACIY